MLFLHVSAQKCQTLHLIELSDIKIAEGTLYITPNHLLKQSKLGKHLDVMTFKLYIKDENMCIVKTLENYIERTQYLRKTQYLKVPF